MHQGGRRQVAHSIKAAKNGRRTCHLVMPYVHLHMLPDLPQGAGENQNAGISTQQEGALDVRRMRAGCSTARKQTTPVACVVHPSVTRRVMRKVKESEECLNHSHSPILSSRTTSILHVSVYINT